MAKEKPGIPKGTRDFDPTETARRELIFETIKRVFKIHGYMPIETPAMENLSTLMGKYGEEGDRLIFRILNSGDFAAKTNQSHWEARDSISLSSQLSEKALRYDLTVPFARYVVQHQHKITFPFKRYQIQPVWRADRPQKGRYREFFQCDVDVIGSRSLTNEAELIEIIGEVFSALNIRVVVKINNRKILAGLAEHIGYADRLTDITTAIDKLDKTGMDNVEQELLDKGLSMNAIELLRPVLSIGGDNGEKLDQLSGILRDSVIGLKGVDEMREVLGILAVSPPSCQVELDLTLARGLNYYTGAIIEVKAMDFSIGSICGGGRYDDLTGIFGLPDVSGVGISFGADRVYDVMAALDLFPAKVGTYTKLLVLNFGEQERNYCLPILKQLRDRGIGCELYPDQVKLKKQMQYADKNQIPYVLMAGESEMAAGVYTLKNMHTGEQFVIQSDQIADKILNNISL